MTFLNSLRLFPREAVVWMVGLIALGFYNPLVDAHSTVCPLSTLGFDFCPGCGLGRSISFLFHGEFINSFEAHPLGIITVIILTYRIVSLTLTHNWHYGKTQ